MFHSLKALNFNHITVNQFNTGPVKPLDVCELVTDFMIEGKVSFKNKDGINKTISSLSVTTALTKKVNASQLTELLEMARKHHVFDLTQLMRDLLKEEAAAQIQAALTA
jgi:hypothetical protein